MTWHTVAQFFAAGAPQTKGSTSAFAFKRKDGSLGANVTNSNKKARPWQDTISGEATLVFRRPDPLVSPIQVRMQFYFDRPKGHFRKSGELAKGAPTFPITKRADIDKAERVVLDALTGVIYRDDSQVVSTRADKFYATPTAPQGVWVEVLEWRSEP